MDPRAENPFLDDLFVSRPGALPGVARIHRETFAKVAGAVESLARPHRPLEAPVGLGRLFLLTAPGAGFGKSHLVERLRDQLGSLASPLALPFDRSRPATWPVALASALRQFSAAPASSERPLLSPLDEFSRFFLSRLVLETLACGSMKPRDCPEDPMRLQSEFATLFSRESDSRVLSWVDKRSAELVRAADPGFSRRLGLGPAELAFWTRLFVDFNLRDEGGLDHLRGLSNGEARERLLQLLRVATDLRPALVVADGLDGFHRSETAGMEIADIVNGIREKVPRSVTLLSVNDDLWESVFARCLPSAWIDRLDVETLRLHPIGAEAAKELVQLRLSRVRVPWANANRFAERLAETRCWSEPDEPLTPRRALRQASELWTSESKEALLREEEERGYASLGEPPMNSPIEHAAPFASLRREEDPVIPRSAPAPAVPPLGPPLPEAWRSASVPEATELTATEAPIPPSPKRVECDLAAIDSIINDIRGSGKTVVSESPELPPLAPAAPFSEAAPFASAQSFAPETAPVAQVPGAAPFQAEPRTSPAASPPLSPAFAPVAAASVGAEAPASFFAGFSRTPQRTGPLEGSPAALTRASFDRILAERERELLGGHGLFLDLDRLAKFVRSVGAKHPALAQQEERYPSSRNSCLRWSGHGHSVLVGFESPRNAYFWNNLLQQSLASNRKEKIVAFSHHTEPFDPALFSAFGYSPSVVRARVDLIEMNDRELAMLHAAERCLADYAGSGDEEQAYQLVTLRLDPLWRRIVQAL
jgi:hypothetical protein